MLWKERDSSRGGVSYSTKGFSAETSAEKEEKLFEALRTGNIKEVQELANQGISLEAVDKNGATLLHRLLGGNGPNRLEIFQFLVGKGANIQAIDKGCHTLLHEIVHCLIDKGIDVKAEDDRGWTALEEARVRDKKGKIVQILQESQGRSWAPGIKSWVGL